MKNFFFFLGSFLLLLLFGCSKDLNTELLTNHNDQVQVLARGEICDTCLCIAPNGCTLPCSELDNWETYTADFGPGTPDEMTRWKYLTYNCVTEDGKIGLECHRVNRGDCREEFSCTPCGNCFDY